MGRELILKRRGLRMSAHLEERQDPTLSIDAFLGLLEQFSYNGVQYTLPTATQEEMDGAFVSHARLAYKQNGVVFACMLVRMLLFSEARFQFRQLRNGRPGDLFGTADLAPLENPWPGATTGDLLSKAIQYADLGGNAFMALRPGPMIVPLRPDWVTIVAGSPREPDDVHIWDPDVQLLGYVYQPGGQGSGEEPIPFAANEIAHFAPIPDPEARFRGMSWITPVIREVMSDKAFTEHKLRFTEQGATPNMLVKFPVEDVSKFSMWVDKFREQHEGSHNAFKTLFLGLGMDAQPIGTDFQGLDLKKVQGAGETRIAAAAGVPPVIVGLSEGLEAATYSNYGLARRRFADMTMRPLWRNMAGSLERIINVPGGAELWYDDRDISALKEDLKDAAEILKLHASTMGALIINGYEPDSVTAAVASGDLSQLKHSGLVSVQLQPPGAQIPGPSANLITNGSQPQIPAPPAGRDDSDRALEELLALSIRSQEPTPVIFEPQIDVHIPEQEPPVTNVDVHVPEQPAPVTNVRMDPPEPQEPPVVNVTVPAQEPPVVNLTQDPPVVNLTIPAPKKTGKRTVDFGDGRKATVTDGSVVEFDDGRKATISDEDETADE